jgi:hypothetical protein
MGPRGNAAYSAYRPVVGYQTSAEGFLVAWEGDAGSPLAADEFEIWGQWLEGSDAALRHAPLRVSAMGPDASASFGAFVPELTPVGSEGSFLVVWDGNDDDPGLDTEEFEVWGSLVRQPLIFSDNFEMGTSPWSVVMP